MNKKLNLYQKINHYFNEMFRDLTQSFIENVQKYYFRQKITKPIRNSHFVQNILENYVKV